MASISSEFAAWALALRWVDVAELFFVGMSVIGQHFNSARKIRGFYFWLIGNVVAVWVFYATGRPTTMVLYIYYTVQCVKGIVAWRKLERAESLGPAVRTAQVAPAPLEHNDQALRNDAAALGLA